MSTPESTHTRRPAAAGTSPLIGIAAIISALALLLGGWSLHDSAAQAKKSACVQAAAATYPAVGVSAFNTKSTGPIKVAYDAERKKAVAAC
jgi:hypothetical protein